MTKGHNHRDQSSAPVLADADNISVSEEFDRYSNVYADAVNESLAFSGLTVDFFTKVKAAYFIDILNARLGDAATLDVLDVGCGVGIYHGLIGPKVKSLHGVDISPASIERAKADNLNTHYHLYDGVTLPFKDNSFDAVVTICVLHHVPPHLWENFTSEMARVLRPGGLAVIFEHNPRNPVTMRVVNKCPFDKDAVLLNAAEAKELLSSAELAEVEARFILSIPPMGAALRRIDRLFSPIGLGAQYYAIGRKA